MIKVVIVLNILILSVIIYLIRRRRTRGVTATPVDTEEVLPSVTENAQSIDTVPPDPEDDKGTCELTSNWAMTDQCNADGTAIFTRTYKESKPGACPSYEKADIRPCCYQKGDWKDISACDEGGRKTQEQTTVNCSSDLKTRRLDCKYVGPWRKTGLCNEIGKQLYTRIVVNGNEPMSKYENCCYKGSWKDKECHLGDRKLQFREHINCPGVDEETRWVENGCKYVSTCSSTRNKCGEVNPPVTCDARTGCLPYEG
jgi:hypothetical protein